MFRRTTSALKYSCRFDTSALDRFGRRASSALLASLLRPLQVLPNHRSRPKRRGTVHVCHTGRALLRRPERLSGDRCCCASGRARPSRHPLQPHFRVGRNPSDQLPLSAVVTFLSVVNPKPRPAGLVACLRSTRPGSGHFRAMHRRCRRLQPTFT
jgi:hypothetical protein